MVPAKWQTALGMGTNTGSIIGLVINGFVSDRFGYKRTLQCALAFMTCTLFIPFFAPNREVLLFGQVMQGLPWGIFQTREPHPISSRTLPGLTLRACVPRYSDDRVRVRDLSCCAASVPDHLRQPVLGHRPALLRGCPPRTAHSNGSVGIQDSLRPAMDMAGAHLDWVAVGAGVALVACSQGTRRASASRPPPPDQQEQRRLRPRRASSHE